MAKEKIASPMRSAFPSADPRGDGRDVHDQNPHPPMNKFKHSRSKDTLSMNFFEGEDRTGDTMGLVDEVAGDVLSSPMNGQRRSATGEHESPRSVTSVRLKGG